MVVQYCVKVMETKNVQISFFVLVKFRLKSHEKNSHPFEQHFASRKADISSNFPYLSTNSRYFATHYKKGRLQNSSLVALKQSSPHDRYDCLVMLLDKIFIPCHGNYSQESRS